MAATIATEVWSRYYFDMKLDRHSNVATLLERIGRLITTQAHAEGLLPVHWEALRYLHRANRFSTTAAALTAFLGLTKGTVSQTLKALEAKDLVKKQANARDRRVKHLSLTSKGLNLLQRDPLAETIQAIEQLDSTTQGALANGLKSLLSAQLTKRNRQPFGQCRDCCYFAREHADGEPHYCQLLDEPIAESESLAICFEQRPA